MELRDYQSEAVQSVYDYLQKKTGNPLVVIPTGGGKTPVIATICKNAVEWWGGRVLIVSHVKELLEQNAEKLRAVAPELTYGIYSAGLKKRDTTQNIIIAGIQSIYDKAGALGQFNLLLIDEAHLVPERGEGMYRTLIAGLQEGASSDGLRVVGFTATPYRLGTGFIHGKDKLFDDICYEIGVKKLIEGNYLCPLVGKSASTKLDTSDWKIVRGEFDDTQSNEAFEQQAGPHAREIYERTHLRNSIIVFCSSIAQAQRIANELRNLHNATGEIAREKLRTTGLFDGEIDSVASLCLRDELEERGENVLPIAVAQTESVYSSIVAEVYGDTKSDERARIFEGFRKGRVKYLVNVGVATTGFDAPNVDCVALLRATASPGLYYQMVGRGFRIATGKANCLVLDFGENIERHGPVDRVAPKKAGNGERPCKSCPTCGEVVGANVMTCPDCGYQWPPSEAEQQQLGGSSEKKPLSVEKEIRRVTEITYRPHKKRGADENTPQTLRIDYQLAEPIEWVSEWVCVEHPEGYARNKAEKWWSERCILDCPTDVGEAVMIAKSGWLAEPDELEIVRKEGENFPRITALGIGERPESYIGCSLCESKNLCIFDGAIYCDDCRNRIRSATTEETQFYGERALIEFRTPTVSPAFDLLECLGESVETELPF